MSKEENSPVSSWPQWFERSARHYRDVRMKMAYYEFGKPLSAEVMARIHRDVLNKFPVTRSCRMLDVGGGVGLFSQIFKRRIKQVTLTDISLTMLKSAQELNPKNPGLVCDASSLPFKKNSFERVLCYSVFHYLAGQAAARKVLEEFVRVTKPGGAIFVGDILYPDAIAKRAIEGQPQITTAAKKLFWPKKLSHHLSKKKFAPEFFKNFCKRSGLKCSILGQDIPGKATSFLRYDVLITKGK